MNPPAISLTGVLGLPEQLWLVIRADGQRHFVDKEPLGGMVEWAKGTDVLVVEYKFGAVVHTPKKKSK